jgi:hypothetical protein
MKFSGEHSEEEIRLRVSSETMMMTSSEGILVEDSNRTTQIIDKGSNEMTSSAALAVDFSVMMMISLEVDLETWVASAEDFQVLHFQAVVWVAQEQASKRRL